MNTERCSVCKYWDGDHKSGAAYCRFNPPVIIALSLPSRTGETAWPVTKAGDWCGKLVKR